MYKNLPTIVVSAAALVLTGIVFSVSTSTGQGYVTPTINSRTPTNSAVEAPTQLLEPELGASTPMEPPAAAPVQPLGSGVLVMTTSDTGAEFSYRPAQGEDCAAEQIVNYAVDANGPTAESVGTLSNDDGTCVMSVNYSADGQFMACNGYSTTVVELVVNGDVTQSQRYATPFSAAGCQ